MSLYVSSVETAFPLLVRIKIYFGGQEYPQIDFHSRGRNHEDLLKHVQEGLDLQIQAMQRRGEILILVASTIARVCGENAGREFCDRRTPQGSFDQVIEQTRILLEDVIKNTFSLEFPAQPGPIQYLKGTHQTAWDRAINHLHVRGYKPFRRKRRGNGGGQV